MVYLKKRNKKISKKFLLEIVTFVLLFFVLGCNEETNQSEQYDYDIPSISKVENKPNGIKISWNDINGISNYRVFRKTEQTDWEIISDTNESSYVDYDVIMGEVYFYTIRCTDPDGDKYLSGYTEENNKIKYTYLSTPQLTSIVQTEEGIEIEWSAIEGVDSYRVYRKNIEGKWERIKDLKNTVYLDKNLVSGQKYEYTVRCINSETKIAESDYDHNGLSLVYTILDTPVLSTIENSENGIIISWEPVEEAVQYRVYKKADGDTKWEKIANVKDVIYEDDDVDRGVKYYYTVRCLGADGRSLVSDYDEEGLTIIY